MTKDKAFDEIFHQFRRLSKGIAMKFLHDEGTAEDICQDVFLEFYNKMDTLDYQDMEYVKSWLMVCTRYRAIDYCRKRAHDEKIAEKEEDNRQIREPFLSRNSAEHVAMSREESRIRAEVLQEFKEKFPQDYELLRRVKVEEEASESVADEFEITKNNLYTKLYRSRLWLRDEFKKRYGD